MARTSRKGAGTALAETRSSAVMSAKTYSAAIYARLSVEDSGKNDNGESLENQIYIIKQFISQRPELILTDTYADNGETGTRFDRPQFERLIDDIKAGKIDCVVVKDLSRFGRNYIETGEYIEKIFPFMGVRFIAITDNYDSLTATSGSDSMVVNLKNLINTEYAKDISRKVISSLDTKQRNGEFIGAYAPYGYKKSDVCKNKLIIDEETAPAVRDIFRWKAEGLSYLAIARRLNEMGIPCPSMRLCSMGVIKKESHLIVKLWQSQAVKMICKNLIYIGHMVQGKTREAFCENLPVGKVPQNQWIIVENTHEPLIDMETWEAAQKVMETRKNEFLDRQGRYAHLGNKNNVFKGFVICMDCGSKMVRYKSVSYEKTVVYNFICANRAQNLDLSCQPKNVRERDLLDLVYNEIVQRISLTAGMEATIRRIAEKSSAKKTSADIDARIAENQKKMKQVTVLRSSLFETYTDKLLTESEYIYSKEKYERDAEQLRYELAALEQEKRTLDETLTPRNKCIAAFQVFKDEKAISRAMVEALIERIEVYDYNRVEIVWKFKDELLTLKNYIEGAE